jgi:hypothetical protein
MIHVSSLLQCILHYYPSPALHKGEACQPFPTMSALSDAKSETIHVSSGLPSHARDVLEKRLVRKIDLRLSVVLLLYALNYVSLSSLLLGAYRWLDR